MTFMKRRAGFRLNNRWLLGIAGLIIIFMLFFLARILSRVPPVEPEHKPIEITRQDLDAYTKMLGRVELDTISIAQLPPDLQQVFKQALKMINHRELKDCIYRLTKMLGKRTVEERALIKLFIGFSYYELGEPVSALNAFKEGLELSGLSETQIYHRTVAQLAFNTGYIFQLYAQPESALYYYRQSEKTVIPQTTADSLLMGIILNNSAVASEATGDTSTARQLYTSALNYLNNIGAEEEATKVEKNLQRLTIKSPAGQHQFSP